MAVPPELNEDFLLWLREHTESAWSVYPIWSRENFLASGRFGDDWQRDTKWLNGLSEKEVTAIEDEGGFRFPPDYRLFLRVLNSVDRPMWGIRFQGGAALEVQEVSFYNWQKDSAAIKRAYDELVEGLIFDAIQGNHLWHRNWGKKPRTADEIRFQLRSLVATAPKIIPIFAHRFLLAEPCIGGNPVFSIHQSDIVVFSPNLHNYLLFEFGNEFINLLQLDDSEQKTVKEDRNQICNAKYNEYQAIPFWGEFL